MPLSGLRVVSVAVNLPGPVVADQCARAGAEVTTLLPPSGDPMATYSPELFDHLHPGQQLRTCDLRTEAGRAQAHELLAEADLLITSSRPAALARMGMDFVTTSALNPRLCQVDIVGYPGPRAELPGHDLTYQAVHGLVADTPPRTAVSDLAGGLMAFSQALLALRQRDTTGHGSRAEVALSTTAEFMALPAEYGLTSPGGLLGGGNPCYEVYTCADGHHVALAALEPHFRSATLAALRISPDAPDLRAELTAAFATRPAAEWESWAQTHDIPLAVCR